VGNYPNELLEMALAHAVGNKVEAAYRRGNMLAKRHQLMRDWEAFCTKGGVTFERKCRKPFEKVCRRPRYQRDGALGARGKGTAEMGADDEWITIKWLRAKRDQRELSGTPLISEAIKFLVDVDCRLPMVGPTDATPVSWPGYTHDAEDQADALKQRLIDIAAGDDPKKVLGLQEAATTSEITAAESMERVFRSHLAGENQNRDWQILWRLAKGESLRKTAKEIEISKSNVEKRRDVQLEAIWQGISHLMPKPIVRTGIVWDERIAA
jgi:hypothetical protein